MMNSQNAKLPKQTANSSKSQPFQAQLAARKTALGWFCQRQPTMGHYPWSSAYTYLNSSSDAYHLSANARRSLWHLQVVLCGWCMNFALPYQGDNEPERLSAEHRSRWDDKDYHAEPSAVSLRCRRITSAITYDLEKTSEMNTLRRLLERVKIEPSYRAWELSFYHWTTPASVCGLHYNRFFLVGKQRYGLSAGILSD